VLTLVPADTAKIDAFSTAAGPRPIIVLTPGRADDVYRHRFTAAHELGHLLLHGDVAPGDPQQEREADAFAAEFLTPGEAIIPALPPRLDLGVLQSLGRTWGVSIESLVYRSHEVGRLSEASYRRAFQRIRQHRDLGLIVSEPVRGYPGEIPTLFSEAFDVAAQAHGTTMTSLARQLRFTERRLTTLMGGRDDRPPALGSGPGADLYNPANRGPQ
jgi:Zn-dependent peptidase ImmA (M78 family)